MKKSLNNLPTHALRCLPGLLAALLILAMPLLSRADVEIELSLWHGYSYYYGDVSMAATNPAPVTYHRVESPGGLIWQHTGSDNSGSSASLSLTNDLAALMNEVTNGLWTLILNAGDVSAQTNAFTVSAANVTTGLFGNIVLSSPTYGETVTANPPTISWTGPSHLPTLSIQVAGDDYPYTYGDSATLPSTTTNWTPSAPLGAFTQSIYMYYRTNNYVDINFSAPTNLAGGATLPNWSATAQLSTYIYSIFDIQGSGSEFDIAVESPGLSWTTGGDYGGDDWFVQSNEYSVGNSALQSGYVPDYATSWVETTVQGPGTLIFKWNILADDNDYFSLSVSNLYGEYEDWSVYGSDRYGWDYYEVYLESGDNVLRWTFSNDDDSAVYEDAAFLDEVEYYPVTDYEADFELNIQRVTSGTNNYYVMFPSFSYTYPDPVTTHEVASPNWLSTGGSGSSSSQAYDTLQELIDEIEYGDWTLSFNADGPGAREYYFTVTVDALTTNDLPAVAIIEPLDGATGVATNTGYMWIGPFSFDSLTVYARSIDPSSSLGFANLPPGDTSWPGGPVLPAGTNSFDASYSSNNFAGLTISEPMDWDYNTLLSWSATTKISTRGSSRFVTSTGLVPLPVTILPPVIAGGNLGLSFLSQSGATHVVEWSTNLVTGPWMPATNFPGSGTTHFVDLPATNNAAFYRVNTQ
jgi:hypothetical protein